MKHNVGKIDRIIRISIAITIGILFFFNIIEGKLANILGPIGVILAMTSLRQCCPLYAILGMGTCGTDVGESDIKIKTKKINLK
jgi:hypothetical protein